MTDPQTSATAVPEPLRISFLTPGNFEDGDPERGLEDALDLFAYGERLGFDGAWIRQRHLEHGVAAAAVFLAAASQRTSTIELGTGVIPLGYENPFHLAEELATVDALSRGRLQAGVSVGPPPHLDLIAPLALDVDVDTADFSHTRAERLLQSLRSEYLGDDDTVIRSPGNVQRPRLQPVRPGLTERVWYGGSSNASIDWAARAGVNLIVANIGSPDNGDEFFAAQLEGLRRYRARFVGTRTPRVAVGRVLLPTDGADADVRRRYAAYEASRIERTKGPFKFGGRTVLIAPDYVGTSAEIVERLLQDPVVAEAGELQVQLPYEFTLDDYRQVLSDVATHIVPALQAARVASSGVLA